jgi:chlorophyllide a reductase subunit Y
MRAPNCWSRRLLVESGADLRYVGTACRAKPLRRKRIATWLEAAWRDGDVPRLARKRCSAAFEDSGRTWRIGTTPVVQKAKERSVPALYFTNLISARPLMGPAGAGSLAQVVNAALANTDRLAAMTDFFEGVGTGHAAGIWEDVPKERPDFEEKACRRATRKTNAVDNGEAVGC